MLFRSAFLAEERHGCAIVRLALPDRFIEHGTIRELHQSVGLEGKAVAERIMPILEQR